MLRLPSGLLPSAFHIRTLYVLLLSPTSATCSAHFILLVIFGNDEAPHHAVFSSPLSAPCSRTPLAPVHPLMWEVKFRVAVVHQTVICVSV